MTVKGKDLDARSQFVFQGSTLLSTATVTASGSTVEIIAAGDDVYVKGAPASISKARPG
jgi:hypothetical protein